MSLHIDRGLGGAEPTAMTRCAMIHWQRIKSSLQGFVPRLMVRRDEQTHTSILTFTALLKPELLCARCTHQSMPCSIYKNQPFQRQRFTPNSYGSPARGGAGMLVTPVGRRAASPVAAANKATRFAHCQRAAISQPPERRTSRVQPQPHVAVHFLHVALAVKSDSVK